MRSGTDTLSAIAHTTIARTAACRVEESLKAPPLLLDLGRDRAGGCPPGRPPEDLGVFRRTRSDRRAAGLSPRRRRWPRSRPLMITPPV
ncbi:hypothetical protein GCM10009533_29930 [Saccharopolyspora spinosporotrichia]|uniref:Uncharacterized protein n=1 Tax=Saccharopolyspora erythraea TaxID=1836 RepID=A0ABP3MV55_SACER|nr:hypothetical protein N599_13070 [Saccharopolyspora erythraea D]